MFSENRSNGTIFFPSAGQLCLASRWYGGGQKSLCTRHFRACKVRDPGNQNRTGKLPKSTGKIHEQSALTGKRLTGALSGFSAPGGVLCCKCHRAYSAHRRNSCSRVHAGERSRKKYPVISEGVKVEKHGIPMERNKECGAKSWQAASPFYS